MNKVYNYLGLFRNFCLRNFFGGMYDRYYGTNEDELRKKHFYENFVKNAIFEEGNELHELAIQPIECKNCENLVKVFAERIYGYLKRCEDNYIILGNGYDYDYKHGAARQFMSRRTGTAPFIVQCDLLDDFKQAGTAGDPVSLETGRDGQADGFFCPGRVSHNKVNGKRVKTTVRTLHGSVETFEVDGDKCVIHNGWLKVGISTSD